MAPTIWRISHNRYSCCVIVGYHLLAAWLSSYVSNIAFQNGNASEPNYQTFNVMTNDGLAMQTDIAAIAKKSVFVRCARELRE
jgi:hypothetical protein